MPSSPSWNDGIFFRFNPESVSKEYNIPLSKTVDYQAFMISNSSLFQNSRRWVSGNYFIYPLTLEELNSVVKKVNYPVPKDFWKTRTSLRIRGNGITVEFPEVMAIINMTPDSFYPGSRFKEEEVREKLDSIRKSGANIVDIGGSSTRPGSEQVTAKEELSRIKKTVEISLEKKFVVSIDSYQPEVLKECLEMGTHIINDVTGMENPEVGKLAKEYDVPLIIMHKKGDFRTMQLSPHYENVVQEIISYFLKKMGEAKKIGIEDNIILDPGIGFGKRTEDNIAILKNLRDFKLGHLLLIGLSRKHFIGEIMNETVDDRGVSSLILNSIAIQNGADIIRVHDVDENMKLIKIIKKIKEF